MGSWIRPSSPDRGELITAGFLRQVVDGLAQRIHGGRGIVVNKIGTNLTVAMEDFQGGATPGITFLAKITGNLAITANARWKYAWSEVRIASGGLTVETFTGSRSGTTGAPSGADLGWALNIVELANTTATAIGGDGILPSNTATYPAGFKRRPIGGGGTTDTHTLATVVRMFLVSDAGGVTRALFGQPNPHFGAACT